MSTENVNEEKKKEEIKRKFTPCICFSSEKKRGKQAYNHYLSHEL